MPKRLAESICWLEEIVSRVLCRSCVIPLNAILRLLEATCRICSRHVPCVMQAFWLQRLDCHQLVGARSSGVSCVHLLLRYHDLLRVPETIVSDPIIVINVQLFWWKSLECEETLEALHAVSLAAIFRRHVAYCLYAKSQSINLYSKYKLHYVPRKLHVMRSPVESLLVLISQGRKQLLSTGRTLGFMNSVKAVD